MAGSGVLSNTTEAEQALLEAFDKEPEDSELLPRYLDVLRRIAETGTLRHPWPTLRKLVLKAVTKVLKSYREAAVTNGTAVAAAAAPTKPDVAALESTHAAIIAQLASRSGCPFTLQRICELVVSPGMYYKNVFKLTRAFDKLVTVTTDIEPGPPIFLPERRETHGGPQTPKRARIEATLDEVQAGEKWPDPTTPPKDP
eukprot:m.35819 g.35819  ORF g.35819 m.35819 type:complete len:199 (+) comp9618_c1_seq1:52-648(+)